MMIKNTKGIRKQPHPGKYEGGLFIDPYVDADSYYDEEAGDTETIGFYGLIRGIDADIIREAAKEDGEELTKKEIDFLRNQAGAIIFENSQGFVDVTYYENEDELEEAWIDVEDAAYEGDDEEE